MGAREKFIYSKNPRFNVEQLGEMVAALTGFGDVVWINCKCIAVGELAMDSAVLWGKRVEIQPFHLVPGQEVLCVGHESFYDLIACFPKQVLKDLVVIDGWALYERNYGDVFRDAPIEVFGVTYCAEMVEGAEKPLVERLEDAQEQAAGAERSGVKDNEKEGLF